MKLIGNLKEQVESANNKEEAKEIIEKAGMELTSEELDTVTGGKSFHASSQHLRLEEMKPSATRPGYFPYAGNIWNL